jgi:hypothetical protein
LDFHHYKDLEEDRVEMAEEMVAHQEEIVVKEIVVQGDQTMDLDTEDQEQEIVAQEDQMMELDTEDQDQDLELE